MKTDNQIVHSENSFQNETNLSNRLIEDQPETNLGDMFSRHPMNVSNSYHQSYFANRVNEIFTYYQDINNRIEKVRELTRHLEYKNYINSFPIFRT